MFRMVEFVVGALMLMPSLVLSQVTSEQVDYDYQIAYCVGTSASTAWIGETVVVMIEDELPTDRDSSTMAEVVGIFEDIIAKFEELTGLVDLPIASSYDGKPVIEIVLDNCGAGGLAHHGVLGMSTGKPFLDDFYNLVEEGNISVPQVFFYELNRNFWLAGMDGFNGKFDWAMDNEPQNYGWWTVGMNNAQAYIIPKSLNIGLDYFGSDINYWETRMVKELEDYMSGAQFDFDFGWRQSLMPWHSTESINDLMSGLIIYSYNNFGGEVWVKGFYEQLQNDEIPNRSYVFAYQECRDNIYKIWSIAANQDLASFFENDLRWIITDNAKTYVDSSLYPTSTFNLQESKSLFVYPNPVSNWITIESDRDNNPIQVFNSNGQLVVQAHSTGPINRLNLEHLSPGVYWLSLNGETVRVLKE